MSLINTLLQEIEKIPRQESNKKLGVQPNLSHQSIRSHILKSTTKKIFMIIFMMMSIITLFFLLIHNVSNKNKILASNFQAPTQSEVKPQPLAQSDVKENIKTIATLGELEMASTFYQKAVSEIKNDDIVHAELDLKEAITKNPQLQQAREALIVLLIQNKNMTQALETVNDGLMLSPLYLPFIKLKAHVLVELEQYKDALDLLSENAPEITHDPDYYALMAAAYEKDKNYMVAARVYHQLTYLQPEEGQWWFGLGASLQMAGKKNAAIEAYQRALETGGLKPNVRAYIESQLQELG